MVPQEPKIRKASYKLYPTPKQALALDALLRSHQQLYNAALEERISAWSKAKKSISYADQCKSLTALRTDLPEWQLANCSSQQMTLRRLGKAFDAFFRRVKAGQTPGFPRFKSLARFAGFSFKSHGDGWRFTKGEKWKNGTLRLSGVGHIACRGKARQGGRICASDILHRDGEWFLSLTLEVEHVERVRTGNAAIALDWGVATLLSGVRHDGTRHDVQNPRWYQSDKERVTELQQCLSRKKRGSQRRKKAVRALARARSEQARRRLDFLHKETARIAKEHGLVAMEELTVKSMTASAKGTLEEPGMRVAQKAGLNREILDTAPALLMQLLSYKVQDTGGDWAIAPTKKLKPSQTCPCCGAVSKKALEERVHLCASCGHTEPRDTASARVVLNWALYGTPTAPKKISGQELAETGFIPRETPSFAQA
jgi:putative transposase